MAAEIAAVVGNHQGEHVLRDCLESLTNQTRPVSSLLVVDGASTDRSPELAEELGARVLRAPNRGLGFLYNLGARAAECDYVLLSNNDVAYEPDCLAHLADALDADEQRFAADPTQLDWSNGRVIHARTSLARGRLWREYLPGLHLDDAEHADSIVPTVSAHGAAMLVRRDRMLELGGFDETFFMEWEDLDLCWRAWAAWVVQRLRAAGAASAPRRRGHERGDARATQRLVAPQPAPLRAQVPAASRRGTGRRR